jgi:predicted lipid-binding transport protein (Tim44 family)
MKTALWKSMMLGMALGVLFALGAFAEGTIGFFGFCLLAGALVQGVCFACAQAERCEAEAHLPARAAAMQSPAKPATVRRPAAKTPRRAAKAGVQRSLRVA